VHVEPIGLIASGKRGHYVDPGGSTCEKAFKSNPMVAIKNSIKIFKFKLIFFAVFLQIQLVHSVKVTALITAAAAAVGEISLNPI
jgi:hypothetical protein